MRVCTQVSMHAYMCAHVCVRACMCVCTDSGIRVRASPVWAHPLEANPPNRSAFREVAGSPWLGVGEFSAFLTTLLEFPANKVIFLSLWEGENIGSGWLKKMDQVGTEFLKYKMA